MRSRLAGLAAVARLVCSAADHYVTALVGLPPVAWITRQIVGAVRDAYRLGRFGPPSTCTDLAVIVYDGEILEEKTHG
jgi:hypothetical protein